MLCVNLTTFFLHSHQPASCTVKEFKDCVEEKSDLIKKGYSCKNIFLKIYIYNCNIILREWVVLHASVASLF